MDGGSAEHFWVWLFGEGDVGVGVRGVIFVPGICWTLGLLAAQWQLWQFEERHLYKCF